MANLLKARSDEIGSLASILGVLIGIVGFSFTWYQLYATERTLRSANTYQIQSDARTLIEEIYSIDSVKNYIISGEGKPEDSIVSYKIWQMLNFYLSVFRQEQSKGITSEFADSFKKDFCLFVDRKSISSLWKIMIENEQISEDHEEMRGYWCA
ncbi:MAG: hypothetical protein JJ913_16715 [Rhizobiaceae bacterium]|nr:hypothetical protein [Rhizobiaceae bacterium]